MRPIFPAHPFVLPILHNGLGNMLFQIAAAYALAAASGRTMAVIESMSRPPRHHPVARYRPGIFSKLHFLPDGTERGLSFRSARVLRERQFAAGDFEPKIPAQGHLLIDGYFQNEGYFRSVASEIIELFSLTPASTTDFPASGQPTCAIHIRRGDYSQHPHIHPTLGEDYLRQAIDAIEGDRYFLIVSDDLHWCRHTLPDILKDRPHRFIADTVPDYEALAIMAHCDDNIIANSTFSWWAAYLNKNPNKRVIAPRRWFTEAHAATLGYDPEAHPIVPKTWLTC